ncbi:MAG TPA: SsrA-binding protein SmpB [Flexilinea sp.]|jgi:SsrA-binding protein|nr:MAG: SsrA-binding protein [Chloroflexi bacterium ADurb.Bin344]HNY93399.1 SsrA-binding protein SmpB [Flexilinea sp.]HOG21162.1 SsrA-binding protein SmpB [Flexilinea sp.]HOG61177.1 SsrA-binding protein SmpB [Flexilinea sp.]HOP00929.1 SsrA-binding protein SmpB [Flexilinea sp.]
MIVKILYAKIKPMGEKIVATNRKAKFEYFILETFEAGIVLKGTEIKSVRAGQISLADAYVQINDGKEAWLMNAHIAPYDPANRYNHDPLRPRKLLLNKREIRNIWNSIRLKGMTIIPTKVYLSHGLAKVEIGIAKGKKLYDKREAIAKRDADRERARRDE